MYHNDDDDKEYNMQPMTILGVIEIVFILWFGVTLLSPLMQENDDE